MLGHLATDPSVALKLRGQQRRTGSGEGINNPPTLLTDPHQLAHQCGGLAGHVVLVGPADRLTDHPRQHRRPPLQRHVALAAPHHVFDLVAETAELRPHALGLVPDRDAAPGEARALQCIGGERELSPVGEQANRCALFQQPGAFGELHHHPAQVGALVAFVASEVGMQAGVLGDL